ncbi:ATP/GTP-binding protein [Sphingomonas sp. BK069]|uniref:AAA family ATPase n=1 Tax=Sphingomonas sp. BK069 TaxID=2586979 RepID=UPI00161559AC|nr:ATP/GTP-binding protein [Sphingomonas sp. BK069]MBB3345956.1 hypothetical protein [Sphingomonas sp. BK069]
MLLRFTVENYLSFNDEASISLVATADRSHPNHLYGTDDERRPAALRIAAVYGANGHGKSKLVEAITALQRHVRGKGWRHAPFKLDPASAKKPTKMIMEFRFDNHDFEYGTVIEKDHVAEEWLFATDASKKEEKIFERATKRTEDNKFKTTVTSGKALSALPSPSDGVRMPLFIKVLGSSLKPTESFISKSDDHDLGLASQAFKWFDDILTPVSATSSYAALFDRMSDEETFRKFIGEYMMRCDIGIERIESHRRKLDLAILDSMPTSFRSEVEQLDNASAMEIGGNEGSSMKIEKDDEGQVYVRDVASIRRNVNGDIVKFSLDEESSGTRRLFDLLPMISDAGDERVYVVDELDRKLHPLLAYEFVQSFVNSSSTQLVFTTHNTYLMSLDLLRRDELWFVQKKPDGSSDLYSLSEMKVRNDLNIRKGYISGRFGAIPFIGSAADLGLSKSERSRGAN